MDKNELDGKATIWKFLPISVAFMAVLGFIWSLPDVVIR